MRSSVMLDWPTLCDSVFSDPDPQPPAATSSDNSSAIDSFDTDRLSLNRQRSTPPAHGFRPPACTLKRELYERTSDAHAEACALRTFEQAQAGSLEVQLE